MEKLRKAGEKIRKKGTEGIFDFLEEALGSIDAFDQVATLLKTVVPMKAEITVKGKKTVEIRALIKNGELWVGFRRSKQAEGVTSSPYVPLEVDEEATEETGEVEVEES